MQIINTREMKILNTKEYLAIRDKAEKTWPQWKIDHYNNSVATSAHANKLQSRIKE